MNDWDEVFICFLVIVVLVVFAWFGSTLGAYNREIEMCKEVAPLIDFELYVEGGECMVTLDGRDLSVSEYYDEVTEKGWEK